MAEVQGAVASQAVEVATPLDVGHPGALAGRQHHPQRVVVVRGVGLVELDVGFGVAEWERCSTSGVPVVPVMPGIVSSDPSAYPSPTSWSLRRVPSCGPES